MLKKNGSSLDRLLARGSRGTPPRTGTARPRDTSTAPRARARATARRACGPCAATSIGTRTTSRPSMPRAFGPARLVRRHLGPDRERRVRAAHRTLSCRDGDEAGHPPRRAQVRRRVLGDRRRDAGLDPHGVEAGGARALDVGLELVADHDHARRAERGASRPRRSACSACRAARSAGRCRSG